MPFPAARLALDIPLSFFFFHFSSLQKTFSSHHLALRYSEALLLQHHQQPNKQGKKNKYFICLFVRSSIHGPLLLLLASA
jgi:hypothetical protein